MRLSQWDEAWLLANAAVLSVLFAGLGWLILRSLKARHPVHGLRWGNAALWLALWAPIAVGIGHGAGVGFLPAESRAVVATDEGSQDEAPEAIPWVDDTTSSKVPRVHDPVSPQTTIDGSQRTSELVVPLASLAWVVLAIGWIVGLYQLARGWRRVRHVERSMRSVIDEGVRDLLRRVASRLGVDVPAVFHVDHLPAPCLVGQHRVRLVLPTRDLEELDARELESVFLHELAHVRHRDALHAQLQRVIGIALWWNPCLPALRRALAHLRECRADRHVLDEPGLGKAYAHLLVNYAERLVTTRDVPAFANLGLLGSRRSELVDRVKHLVTSQERGIMTRFEWSRRWVVLASGLLLATGSVFATWGAVDASSPQDPKPRQKQDVPERPEAQSSGLVTTLSLVQATRIGEPLIVKVRVDNRGEDEVVIDTQSLAHLPVHFHLEREGGQRARIIQGRGVQTMESLTRIAPGKGLDLVQVDLTRDFAVLWPGRWSVQFIGWSEMPPITIPGEVRGTSFRHLNDGTVVESSRVKGVPGSEKFEVTLEAGTLSERDQILARVLPVLAKDWRVTMAGMREMGKTIAGEPIRGVFVELERRRSLKVDPHVSATIFVTRTSEAALTPDVRPKLGNPFCETALGTAWTRFQVRVTGAVEKKEWDAWWPGGREVLKRGLTGEIPYQQGKGGSGR
ncbi:MAG: M56 family metallopeptidase [Planctomycetes bacterium]|nr:M56 family metallopeptidase [Planctomycetota bacterium]MCB9891818.1 M56 family metallopeptidase [Planctomycetota bacterium]